MNIEEFLKSTRIIVDDCCLYDWKIKITDTKRRLGSCNYTKKELNFSKNLILNNSREEIRDTVLHECAHAIAGHGAWHWYKWKICALKIWLQNPQTCNTTANQAEWKYKMQCAGCGEIYHFYKKVSKLNKACYNCCKKHFGWKYHEKFKLIPLNF